MIVSWNAGSLASYAAIRGRVEDDGRIFLRELISALVLDTPPNQSLLGRVLRDPNFFVALGQVTATRRQVPSEREPWNQFSQFALQIERIADQEKVRMVGERHIAKLLVELGQNNEFGFLGLIPKLVHDEVRRLEIGPDFTDHDLKGWHGLIDTNVVLRSKKKVQDIDWREISKSAKTEPVTIWISTVTLHELDTMPLRFREPEPRHKATAFTVWFNERVRTREDLNEILLRDNMRFKFWRLFLPRRPTLKFLSRPIACGIRESSL